MFEFADDDGSLRDGTRELEFSLVKWLCLCYPSTTSPDASLRGLAKNAR